MPAGKAHLTVVGSGSRPYREYALAALAERYRLSALLPAEPTWQRRYLTDWQVADFGDEQAVTAGLAALSGPGSGVLTWGEAVLETTARAARKLGLAHMSPRAAARCRDKYVMRSLLDDAGLPTVRYGLVHSADEAEAVAARIGHPVVIKPRAQAGSLGVVLAHGAEEVRGAFALAEGARYGTLPTGHGVLVEEYLRGPEISVDSVVRDSVATPVHVARKRLGFSPYFEEVGHLVTGWADAPWAEEVRELVVAAHRALGVELGVTHAELRLTPAGPRLVELNGRLGGDLIPYAARIATGIDLVVAAAELAVGRTPDLTPTVHQCAEVRFCYPAYDGRVDRVDVAEAAAAEGIVHADVLVEPGATLLLPPRQVIPRTAVLLAAGPDEAACARALDAAAPLVVDDIAPLAEATARARD
ncbi:ATP-grasp domain-containing protein [Streptomyces sp. NBC_00237]|uniref:ATP-grasp domain-containing protein n=1 Tax=Streptomyces sp. NBC_00237 TaxID=2975687 RepID=UPI002256ED44|nr:ATP-grasp domain-containing protein [Streptomyces sp. NBC_00237]MCX5206815.1 ATP-grasp domain-containing protein [Streptomyces sp. NBC_00237]